MSYQPDPIDTSHVQLPTELTALTERLAESAHDHWAKQRFADHWTYGEQRDDKAKKHPCLVPYAELPGSEKQYDRTMAMETLKAILALGCKITPPVGASPITAVNGEPLSKIAKAAAVSAQKVRQIWQIEDPNQPGLWTSPNWFPQIVCDTSGQRYLDDPFHPLAKAALEFGEAFLALDIAETGIRVLENRSDKMDPLVQQCLSLLSHVKALALARTGSASAAYVLLNSLYERDRNNVEIASAYARAYKDFAFATTDQAIRLGHLRRSHELYFQAYDHAKARVKDFPPGSNAAVTAIFPGINAAATALWIGDLETASRLANEVRPLCETVLAANPGDYWALATVAESYLIPGDDPNALTWYARARAVIDQTRQWASLNSTRKQAQRTCKENKIDFEKFDEVFRFPSLVVFSGHMIDRPDRKPPRFPAEKEEEVRESIRAKLQSLNAGFGICSGACGSDLIFIEEMLVRGAEVHVVLPWRKTEFIRSSVDIGPEKNWKDRFAENLGKVNSVTFLSQQTEPRETRIAYEYLNQCLCGLALKKAAELNARLVPLAVWDHKPGDGPGGTCSFVAFWKKREHLTEHPIELIPLTQPGDAGFFNPAAPTAEDDLRGYEEITVSQGQHTIKTVLFADVQGASKIPELQNEHFPGNFINYIAALIARGPGRPILMNTWGDAVYLVFDHVEEAGNFALKILDLIDNEKWEKERLSVGLNVRIALHTGPVLLCVDPVTRQMTFTGTHVSHAARIEPVVRPGEIWASDGFAAQAAIAALKKHPKTIGFALDYLGQIDFAKSYGRYPLYRLRRERIDRP